MKGYDMVLYYIIQGNMDFNKIKTIIFEFFRYLLVGGIAFIVDSGVLALFKEFVLTGGSSVELVFCIAAGFIAGLIANYVLSLVFVFRKKDNHGNAKSFSSFIKFTVVGLIGLGLTELGMYIGVFVFKWHYLITKILVAGLVTVWNYAGRKVLVFKGNND